MSYSYSKAYDVGLAKKPVVSLWLKESYTPEIHTPQTQPSVTPSVTPSAPVTKGTSDPKIWGPPYWYGLHNSAAHYPIQASQLVAGRMKNRILAIPYEIPCHTCQPHASAYIEKFSDEELNKIVSGRKELVNFYVNFHNEVNKRYGKPIWTYEDAYKFYGGN